MSFERIGIQGPAGSGKDLVSDWFVSQGLIKVAFADPMKRFCQADAIFGLTYEQLWGPSQERNKEFDIDAMWWLNALSYLSKASEEIIQNVLADDVSRVQGYLKLTDWFCSLRKSFPDRISARVILQTLGTEWGRAVDPLMWVRYAHDVADCLKTYGGYYSQKAGYTGAISTPMIQGVVIPDHRFPNEIEGTQARGGHVIRLRRLALEEKVIGIEGHQSESGQKEIPDSAFDLILELDEFYADPEKTIPDLPAFYRAMQPVWEGKLWKTKKEGEETPIVRIAGDTLSQ